MNCGLPVNYAQVGARSREVNGRATAAAVLREIAEGLVDVHGQSEHLSLFRCARTPQLA